MSYRYATRRLPDTKVMVGVTYSDGRTAYIRVEKEDAVHNLILARRAAEHQASGDIPAGTITNVRRVR